jgi:endoribonuclease Dicer
VIVVAVMIHDKIIAHSAGKSGRYARVRAANNAIDVLEGLTPTDFRNKFECSCTDGKNGAVEDHTVAVDCGI